MENLFMIFNSFKKQGAKNLLLIVELTLGMFIMFMVLGRIEYTVQVADKALSVIDKDIYQVFTRNKEYDDGNIAKSSFFSKDNVKELPKDILSWMPKIIDEDSKIKNKIAVVGKSFVSQIFLNRNEGNSYGELKCNYNTIFFAANDKNNMNFYHYKVIRGDDFASYYNKKPKESDINAILIGPPLEKRNPIGSIITVPLYTDYKTKQPLEFKVIGVLDPNYPTLDSEGGQNLGLSNNGYEIIFDKLPTNPVNGKEIINGVHLKLKNKNDIKVIEEELSEKFEGASVKLFNEGERYSSVKEGAKFEIRNIVFVVAMLLISSFGIISISFSTLIKREKEIGIRTAVGAKKRSIVFLLIGEIIIVYIIAFSISIIAAALKSKPASSVNPSYILIDSKVIMGSLLITLIYMFISILPLFIKILRLKPVELIRKS